jgi:NAD(P)-dependent dehydrogenase (short-subunit alcohol dehydrogenase family)
MELSLKGRTALITGAGRGMGRGIAQVFSKEGANIIVADIVEAQATETAGLIKNQGGKAVSMYIDVTDPDSVHNVFETGLKNFKKVDILVNNAGITRMNDFLSIPLVEYKKVFEVNTTGTFICCQEFAKQAIARNYGGNIVNIASNAGKVGFPNQLHYNAAKSAIINMTRNLALELAPFNINVNAVCPGITRSEIVENTFKSVKGSEEKFKAAYPVHYIADAVEVANAVVFLASRKCDFITGVNLPVDGGITAHTGQPYMGTY